jgi:hypothetical protein
MDEDAAPLVEALGGEVRRALVYLFALLAGATVFWGIAWLVGLIFPAAAFWVFCALFGGWAWVGWRYSQSDIWGD